MIFTLGVLLVLLLSLEELELLLLEELDLDELELLLEPESLDVLLPLGECAVVIAAAEAGAAGALLDPLAACAASNLLNSS